MREEDVFAIDLNGGTKALTHDMLTFGASASPDGQWMVVTRGAEGSFSEDVGYEQTQLVLLDRTGKRIGKLPTNAGWNDASAAVSPDGKHIAFVRSKGNEAKLMVTTKSGGKQRLLQQLPGFVPQEQTMSWSPDGDSLALVVWVSPSFDQRLLVVDAKTGDTRDELPGSLSGGQFGPGGAWSHISWSPDGKRLLLSQQWYQTDRQVQELTLRTGTVRNVPNSDGPVWTNATYTDDDHAVVLRFEAGSTFVPQRIEHVTLSGEVTSSAVADAKHLVGGLSVNQC